jgi:primosomal protein N' (replication factor Y)
MKAELGPVPTPPPGAPPDVVSSYEGGRDLSAAIAARRAGTWCLRALPGEDRGALIAELVHVATNAGGTALVGVPEVRYGSLVLDALGRRFPDMARVDSSRSDAARAAGWMQLAAGARVGGGGRSVVLAPARRLRLLVLDEEHHFSYKEDRSPRYDARRVAVERARLEGAACVLISSTPSMETGEAAVAGRFGTVQPARARARAARPIVELVERPRERVLSAELHRRVGAVLERGERAALLVPDRGYARSMWCAACRRSLRCPRCEAGVSYERARARVRCVRCGYHRAPPETCPVCGAVAWRYLGTGSERLYEQVRKAWPRASVARADPETLEHDQQGPTPDVYVTTWIGTKATLRPPVSLVGVLDVDAFIRRPDFRAAESAYQALAEMAEWAGPASGGGRLLIQCSEPAHHAIQAIVRADYRFFLRRELEHRVELGYPPCTELVELRASGVRRAESLDAALSVCREEGARVLGPVAAGPARPGELQALVKCDDAAPVAGRLRDILAAVPPGTRVRVDVDPR